MAQAFRCSNQDDCAAFEASPRAVVEGDVRFDAGSRAMYAADASNFRQVPVAVFMPRHGDDVARALEVCRRFDVPVLPRGAGTAQCGQCINLALVLDISRYMNRVLAVDAQAHSALVDPGVVRGASESVSHRSARHRACCTDVLVGGIPREYWLPAGAAGRPRNHARPLPSVGHTRLGRRKSDAGCGRSRGQYAGAGYCGTTGAFGFEAQHHALSLRIDQARLAPAVRAAPPEALAIANGFSCREQIVQTTGREAMHLAQLLDRARRPGLRKAGKEGVRDSMSAANARIAVDDITP